MNEFAACPTEGAIGLLALLIKSGKLAESRLDSALEGAGLTFVKWRTLDNLVKANSVVGMKCLPHVLNCVKSNVTQLVDRLEADGFARRIPDPDDRRGTMVELTEGGRRAHAKGLEALRAATHELFGAFDETDRTTLSRLLMQLDHTE